MVACESNHIKQSNTSTKEIIDKTFISSYVANDLKTKNNVSKHVSNNRIKNLVILKQCIKDVGYETTMHGLPRVFKSNNWTLKLMW